MDYSFLTTVVNHALGLCVETPLYFWEIARSQLREVELEPSARVTGYRYRGVLRSEGVTRTFFVTL
jgi:hypothetical protein